MSVSQVSIVEFGATHDSPATEAVQRAIDTVSSGGGGTVTVPEGIWNIGTIFLKSGTTLNIVPGGTLRGIPDIAYYQTGSWGHNKDRQPYHLVIISGQHHVTICGGGTIDGSGPAFWDEPLEGSRWYRAKSERPSPMVEIEGSRQVTLDGFTISNSPGWTVHVNSCDHVILRGVTVSNCMLGPNTDGFDINGSRDVFVSDCELHCGDDAIIVKATKDTRSCERVMISNCSVETNCIGIGLGCETAKDIRQVTVTNCVAYRCHRMFAIGMWDGGVVEDVVVSNITGDTLCEFNLARPIHIDVKRRVGSDEPLGYLRNVHICNFVAKTRGRVLLTAQDGTWLDNVLLRDIRLDMVGMEDPMVLSPRDGQSGSGQYSNFNLEARKQRAALIVENARDFVCQGLAVSWPQQVSERIPYWGIWARNVRGGVLDNPLLRGWGGQGEVVKATSCDIYQRNAADIESTIAENAR